MAKDLTQDTTAPGDFDIRQSRHNILLPFISKGIDAIARERSGGDPSKYLKEIEGLRGQFLPSALEGTHSAIKGYTGREAQVAGASIAPQKELRLKGLAQEMDDLAWEDAKRKRMISAGVAAASQLGAELLDKDPWGFAGSDYVPSTSRLKAAPADTGTPLPREIYPVPGSDYVWSKPHPGLPESPPPPPALPPPLPPRPLEPPAEISPEDFGGPNVRGQASPDDSIFDIPGLLASAGDSAQLPAPAKGRQKSKGKAQLPMPHARETIPREIYPVPGSDYVWSQPHPGLPESPPPPPALPPPLPPRPLEAISAGDRDALGRMIETDFRFPSSAYAKPKPAVRRPEEQPEDAIALTETIKRILKEAEGVPEDYSKKDRDALAKLIASEVEKQVREHEPYSEEDRAFLDTIIERGTQKPISDEDRGFLRELIQEELDRDWLKNMIKSWEPGRPPVPEDFEPQWKGDPEILGMSTPFSSQSSALAKYLDTPLISGGGGIYGSDFLVDAGEVSGVAVDPYTSPIVSYNPGLTTSELLALIG